MSPSKLRQVVRRTAARQETESERCELCGDPIPAEHRHMLDLRSRELMCACRACRLLFDSGAAGGGHYRLVPDRRLRLDGFDLDDDAWAELRIPVEIAFFFLHTGEGRVVAFHPSPTGPTEAPLELDAWEQIVRANPVLGTLAPDVEALLVNRSRGARQHFLVPIEECYELVGLIRARERGPTGGEEIESFFGALSERSKTHTGERGEKATRS